MPGEVFEAKHVMRGVGALKEKIGHLRRRSVIVWMDETVTWGDQNKGPFRLQFPPKAVSDEVVKAAQGRGVKIIWQ